MEVEKRLKTLQGLGKLKLIKANNPILNEVRWLIEDAEPSIYKDA